MKKLLSLEVKNFQSHKDTTIDIDTDVLVLSGESNNGKTALLRSLLWLMTNRPSGIGFVSKWAKEKNTKGELVLKKNAVCSVSLTLLGDDDKPHTVVRLRTKDKNLYIVDGVELEAVGTSVPKEVTALLGMHDCNIQSQDDAYFMLTLPPGQVASKLNELVHLDTIDKAYDYNKKGKTRSMALMREWDGMVGKSKLKLDGMKHLPELVDMAEKLKYLSTDLEDTTVELSAAENYLEVLNRNKQALQNAVPDIDTELERLSDLLEDFSSLEDEATAANKQYRNAVAIETALRESELPFEEQELAQLTQLADLIEDYYQATDDLIVATQVDAKWKALQTEMASVEEDLREAEENLPAVCPTCGHELNKESL